MKLPLVTIFTCVYNRADKIRRVFDSVNSQTYPNIEHVIVDDGSTDNLRDLVDGYIAASRHRVVFYAKENGGKHTAANVAWQLASGEYIIQLDSDDELLPHAVEYLTGLWNAIPEDEKDKYWCVHGRCMDQASRKLIGGLYPENINSLPPEKAKIAARRTTGEKTGLMRASVIKKFRYPENKLVKFVTESVVWTPVNDLYRTYYSNEIVRIYYINEGDCLSKPKRTRQSFTDKCFYYRWLLLHKKTYHISALKAVSCCCRCCLSHFLSLPAFKKETPYFFGGLYDKSLCALLWPPAKLLSAVLAKKYGF